MFVVTAELTFQRPTASPVVVKKMLEVNKSTDAEAIALFRREMLSGYPTAQIGAITAEPKNTFGPP